MRKRRPPRVRSRSHGRPFRTCSPSEDPRNCTDSQTSLIPLCARLDRGKSMSWYDPRNGSAGFARSRVRTSIRLPAPPAWMMARTCPRVMLHRAQPAGLAHVSIGGEGRITRSVVRRAMPRPRRRSAARSAPTCAPRRTGRGHGARARRARRLRRQRGPTRGGRESTDPRRLPAADPRRRRQAREPHRGGRLRRAAHRRDLRRRTAARQVRRRRLRRRRPRRLGVPRPARSGSWTSWAPTRAW